MGGQTTIQDRGFTLLEVLVAIAAAGVIFGIALGILVTTNQTVNQAIGKESVLQHAQLAMKEIHSVIEGAVWPEDLATSPSINTSLVFEKERVGIFSTHNPTSGQFSYFMLGNIPLFVSKEGRSGEARSIAGCIRSHPRTGQSMSSFSVPRDKYDSTLEFSYATEGGADLQPLWRESLPPGQRPRLIWVELVVRDREQKNRQGQLEEVRLATAVSL